MAIHVPEAAIRAAAEAIFEKSVVAGWDADQKARCWLEDAEEYRDLARTALEAALPHLKQSISRGHSQTTDQPIPLRQA